MTGFGRRFQFLWLTSTPFLRGNWVAIGLSLAPAAVAVVALVITAGVSSARQGPGLFSAALFLSLSAVLIQYPAFMGRVELTDQAIEVADRLSGRRGRLRIPRQAIQDAFFVTLTRPPRWLPLLWGAGEITCLGGAASAGWSGGGAHWYWLAAWAAGLSLWPSMTARWQATMEVILVYRRARRGQTGLIRAWGTPHQAGSLIHTLQGKIDWEIPPQPGGDERQPS